MASKKKNPYDMFDALADALNDAYQESNDGQTFEDALADLENAFDRVMSFLSEPE